MKLSRAAAIAFACNTHHQFTNAADLIRAQEGTRITNHYIITLKDEGESTESVQGKAENIIDEIQGQLTQVYTNVMQGFAASLSYEALNNVLNDDRVTSVEEDAVVQLDAFGPWGLDRIGEIDLPLHQSRIPTIGDHGAGVTAYVIDTGILASYEEFEGRASQEFSSVNGELNEDCNGHGTHVAAIVGSKTYGVAKKARLVGVKVLSCSGTGSHSGVIAGIDWVKSNANKPATVNISLAGLKSNAVNAAVENLVNSGVPTVVTAGNGIGDACQKSPASVLSAITVISTRITDAQSSLSNGGSCVDVFVSGSGVETAYIDSGSATRLLSENFMASPLVCGAVALYLGQDSNLSPTTVSMKILADFNSDKTSNAGSGTSNRMLVVGGSRKKPFVTGPEVQGQVRIYCKDPLNYNTTKYGPMQDWDVSQVTSMFEVFDMEYNGKINKCDIPDISRWDVSRVYSFGYMFQHATSFNRNIGNWDVSKGTGLYGFIRMFKGATAFNQNICNWDVSKGTSFRSMFYSAASFNQNIGNWNVFKSNDFKYMFVGASKFKQNLNKWLKRVTKVSNLSWCRTAVCNAFSLAPTKSPSATPSLLPSATLSTSPSTMPSLLPSRLPSALPSEETKFTSHDNLISQVKIYCVDPINYSSQYGPIEDWDVSSITDMESVFDATEHECDIPDIHKWDVSQVTNFKNMFNEATYFNVDIRSWDVSRVTSFTAMFKGAMFFNQDISKWNVSKATDFSVMFHMADSFNANICNWDVSKGTNFEMMFFYATLFNQNISNWDVSKAINFNGMFKGALSFNQNISRWDISKATNFNYMLSGAHSFSQDLRVWLKSVNRAHKSITWCEGGAVCDASVPPTAL